jgi:hypothetical protein
VNPPSLPRWFPIYRGSSAFRGHRWPTVCVTSSI